jgi:lipopolysaccharide/colanic/teichoic acid biosynthesis glycosyltransferase
MSDTTAIPSAIEGRENHNFTWFLRLDCFARRLMDICVALVGLLLLAPVFALIGMLIKRDSPGPVFYRGARLGKAGKRFGILKFRTMYERPESHDGPKVTAEGDQRITPFGQWLRDTKINELPQLWNVLIGEMSLVGPRPEDPELAAAWPEDIRAELLAVRPGVTSPASIVYRNEEKMLTGQDFLQGYLQEILPSKLRLDRLYLRGRTVLSDLDVIFLTAVTLLPQMRQNSIPQHLLYWGPLARISSRVGMWFVLDVLVSLMMVGASGLFWRTLTPLNVGVWEALMMAVGIAFYFSLFNSLLGLNNIAWSKAGFGEILLVFISGGLGTLLLMISDRPLLGRNLFPGGMMLLAGAMCIFGFVAVRYRERLITSLASRWLAARQSVLGSAGSLGIGERVLVVGAGEMGSLATWLFTHGEFSTSFQIVGMVDDDPRKIGMVVGGVKILNTTEHISELIKKLDIGVVVFAITRIEVEERQRILLACQDSHVKLVLFPDLMEILHASFLPLEQAAQAGVQRNEQNGVLQRIEKDQLDSWLSELDGLLAVHDVHAARALLAKMREHHFAEPMN